MKTSRYTLVLDRGGSSTGVEYTNDGYGSSENHGRGSGGGRRSTSRRDARNGGGGEPKRQSGPPMNVEGKTYEEIKAQCLRKNRLFEDPDFPADDSSVFPSKPPPRPLQWKRPCVSNFTTTVCIAYP